MDERALHALIEDQRQEHLRLAFLPRETVGKAEAERARLSMQVSAMANAEGGTIVLGLEARAGAAASLDPVDSKTYPKGWLESQLEASIQPPIDGLVIEAVALEHKPDRCVYVLSVPRSVRAPHQASDRRYYKRAHNQAVAMEDYEVRDVLSRARAPDVRAELSLEARRDFGRSGKSSARLLVLVKNLGAVPARDVYAEVRVPESAVSSLTRFPGESPEGRFRVYRWRYRDEGGPLTLYPGAHASVTDGARTYIALEWSGPVEDGIECLVYADGGAPRSARLAL